MPGSKYGTSDKGWITTELFESCFTELFLTNAVASCPLLLLLDSHSTNYQPDVINLAFKNHVLILCLPTHMYLACNTAPWIVLCFLLLKPNGAHFAIITYIQKNPGIVITRFILNGLFSRAGHIITMLQSTS